MNRGVKCSDGGKGWVDVVDEDDMMEQKLREKMSFQYSFDKILFDDS